MGTLSFGKNAFASQSLGLAALVLAVTCAACATSAEPDGDPYSATRGEPVYQRHAYPQSPIRGRRGDPRSMQNSGPLQNSGPPPQQINAGWFQRPYPYHLDYYRMRYGGSYAPYFGNLYGPPQVVTAPPYYGPYYGGYGNDPYGFQGDAYQGAYGAAPTCAPARKQNAYRGEQCRSKGYERGGTAGRRGSCAVEEL